MTTWPTIPTTAIDEAHNFEPHYDRHVWLYRRNANGMFAQFNPTVTCQFHKPMVVAGKGKATFGALIRHPAAKAGAPAARSLAGQLTRWVPAFAGMTISATPAAAAG